MPPPRRLIVNADDFALTTGVNRAVGELSQAQALRSTTLMAAGSAFADAVQTARAHPGLGVGCHVVLVDGVCVAPPDMVPALRLDELKLRDSLPAFLLDLQRGKIPEKQIELEAVAQIRKLQEAGVTVTHVDSHKHTHLFPRVARPLMRAAIQCGVSAIRNPFEQAWSAGLTRGPLLRKLEVAGLRNFSTTFRKLLRASGLKTTEGSVGVSATGSLDAANLRRLLDGMPEGTWELVCHPGYNDRELDQVRTRLRSTRDVERNALLEQIPAAVRAGKFELISFRDL
ncbi:MAG: ChbG/HpnK family deacetylase [Terriglobus sp.]